MNGRYDAEVDEDNEHISACPPKKYEMFPDSFPLEIVQIDHCMAGSRLFNSTYKWIAGLHPLYRKTHQGSIIYLAQIEDVSVSSIFSRSCFRSSFSNFRTHPWREAQGVILFGGIAVLGVWKIGWKRRKTCKHITKDRWLLTVFLELSAFSLEYAYAKGEKNEATLGLMKILPGKTICDTHPLTTPWRFTSTSCHLHQPLCLWACGGPESLGEIPSPYKTDVNNGNVGNYIHQTAEKKLQQKCRME